MIGHGQTGAYKAEAIETIETIVDILRQRAPQVLDALGRPLRRAAVRLGSAPRYESNLAPSETVPNGTQAKVILRRQTRPAK